MNSNKENYNFLNQSSKITNYKHTSFQTTQNNWKPSIRVGYKPKQSIDASIQSIKNSKLTEPIIQKQVRKSQKKHIFPSFSNKNLNQCAGRREQSKGNTKQSYDKYHRSSLFSIEDQSIKTLRLENSAHNSRKNLPSYKNNCMNQILQYSNVNNFRPAIFTEKCNNIPIQNRNFKYQDLHDYDFRHRPQKFE